MKQRKWRKTTCVWWVKVGRIVDGKEVWTDATYKQYRTKVRP